MTDDWLEVMLEMTERGPRCAWVTETREDLSTIAFTKEAISDPLTHKREGRRLKPAKCHRCGKWDIEKGDRAVVLKTYETETRDTPTFAAQLVYHPNCFSLDVSEVPKEKVVSKCYPLK